MSNAVSRPVRRVLGLGEIWVPIRDGAQLGLLGNLGVKLLLWFCRELRNILCNSFPVHQIVMSFSTEFFFQIFHIIKATTAWTKLIFDKILKCTRMKKDFYCDCVSSVWYNFRFYLLSLDNSPTWKLNPLKLAAAR